MELMRYLEKDSKTALEKIRKLHGDDALIVSTEKVGTKTEVIVGVEKPMTNSKSQSNLDQVTITDESFNDKKHQNTEKSTSNRDPWQFVRELNKEIALIKEEIASFKSADESKAPIDMAALETSIKKQGHNLGVIESSMVSWIGPYLVLGVPGSGKSTIVEKIYAELSKNTEMNLLKAFFQPSGTTSALAKPSSMTTLHLTSKSQFRGLMTTNLYDVSLTELGFEDAESMLNFVNSFEGEGKLLVCIPMDQDSENIESLIKSISNLDTMLVPTRLDLCKNLPSKLELLTRTELKIAGVSTGVFR